MPEDLDLSDLTPEDAHARARAALVDPFFWNLADDDSPFGNETGAELYAAFRDWREENPHLPPLTLLSEILVRWEVTDNGWDIVEPDAVLAIGQEDEYGLLTRDDAILGLAFAQIVLEGRLDRELRRRAVLAVRRQMAPPLLRGWEARMDERVARLTRMGEVLSQKWD